MDVTASHTTSILDSSQYSFGPSIPAILLDGFAGDLLVSMSQESSLSGLQSFSTVAHGQYLGIDGQPQCVNRPANLIHETTLFVYANGSNLTHYDNGPPTIPSALNASVANYLQVFAATVSFDVGIQCNNSILISPDLVNATLDPNEAVSSALELNYESFYAYYPQWWTRWSMLRSAARTMREGLDSVDLYSLFGPSPAVIAMTYTCHVQQLKAPLNFVVCMFNHYSFLFCTS